MWIIICERQIIVHFIFNPLIESVLEEGLLHLNGPLMKGEGVGCQLVSLYITLSANYISCSRFWVIRFTESETIQ
jgi:hypothetical protein